MQALFALVWIGAAIGFTIFWMVVGWRAMTALESIARTLGRVSSGARSPIDFP